VNRANGLNGGQTTVTVIGGGTGSFSVLTGLKAYPEIHLRSIVTMMDSGGDSGRLRDEFGVLPPGDVRRCLVALSEETLLLRDLFSFRFAEQPLQGRSFGNLLFLALTKILGSEEEATEAAGRILKIGGEVIPVTWDNAHLCARLDDGSLVRGEANIGVPKAELPTSIVGLHLDPSATANPRALAAIAESDYIVLAPGSLYTSTLPNLLVEGIADTLQATPATVIYVANLMTCPGETDGYTVSRHVEQIVRYGRRIPDAVLVHEGWVPPDLVERYEAEGSYRVPVDADALRSMGVRRVLSRNVMSTRSLVRHDPDRAAKALVELLNEPPAASG